MQTKTITPFVILCALAAPVAAAAPTTPAHAAAATAATAAAAPDQRSLDIEISETATGKTATPVRLVVPLVVDSNPSEMRVRQGATFYHLVVSARRHRGGSVIIELALERRDGSDGSPNDFEIKVQAVPAQGKRSTLVAAERPDGSRMEVTLAFQ